MEVKNEKWSKNPGFEVASVVLPITSPPKHLDTIFGLIWVIIPIVASRFFALVPFPLRVIISLKFSTFLARMSIPHHISADAQGSRECGHGLSHMALTCFRALNLDESRSHDNQGRKWTAYEQLQVLEKMQAFGRLWEILGQREVGVLCSRWMFCVG